jgi:hypothetical protein
VRDFEIGKFFEIRQLKIPDTSNSLPDCFVKGNDSVIDTGVSDQEQVDDIFSIVGEFLHSMEKGKNSCSNCSVPGDGLIPSIPDHLCGFDSSEGDFKVSEFLNFCVIEGGGELSAKY